MKTRAILLMILFASLGIINAQDPRTDPLAETYIIRNGGGDELVTIQSGDKINVNIYKYYKAFERFSRDTLVKTLTWTGDTKGDPHDMDLADLDRDESLEIVAAWNYNKHVEIAVLKPDPERLVVDSINAWEKTVRLGKSSPAIFSSSPWPILSCVLVQTGNLDSD